MDERSIENVMDELLGDGLSGAQLPRVSLLQLFQDATEPMYVRLHGGFHRLKSNQKFHPLIYQLRKTNQHLHPITSELVQKLTYILYFGIILQLIGIILQSSDFSVLSVHKNIDIKSLDSFFTSIQDIFINSMWIFWKIKYCLIFFISDYSIKIWSTRVGITISFMMVFTSSGLILYECMTLNSKSIDMWFTILYIFANILIHVWRGGIFGYILIKSDVEVQSFSEMSLLLEDMISPGIVVIRAPVGRGSRRVVASVDTEPSPFRHLNSSGTINGSIRCNWTLYKINELEKNVREMNQTCSICQEDFNYKNEVETKDEELKEESKEIEENDEMKDEELEDEELKEDVEEELEIKDDFKREEKYMLLPCNHLFHISCIAEWFFTKPTFNCPLCEKMSVTLLL